MKRITVTKEICDISWSCNEIAENRKKRLKDAPFGKRERGSTYISATFRSHIRYRNSSTETVIVRFQRMRTRKPNGPSQFHSRGVK